MIRTGEAPVVRLYVTSDPGDPLLFLVTADPGVGYLPVIPTGPAHQYWVGSSVAAERDEPERGDHERHVSPNHPSVIGRVGPGTG
jgi:hypothetical protein